MGKNLKKKNKQNTKNPRPSMVNTGVASANIICEDFLTTDLSLALVYHRLNKH